MIVNFTTPQDRSNKSSNASKKTQTKRPQTTFPSNAPPQRLNTSPTNHSMSNRTNESPHESTHTPTFFFSEPAVTRSNTVSNDDPTFALQDCTGEPCWFSELTELATASETPTPTKSAVDRNYWTLEPTATAEPKILRHRTAKPTQTPTKQLSSKEQVVKPKGPLSNCVDCAEKTKGKARENDQNEESHPGPGLVVGLSCLFPVFIAGVAFASKWYRHEKASFTGIVPELLSDDGEAFDD